MIGKVVTIKLLSLLISFALYAIDCIECLPIGGMWTQIGMDIDGEFMSDRFGYSVATSADGLTIAISAIGYDGSGSDSDTGRVSVYSFISGSWVMIGQGIDGEASGDGSGTSIALSDDGTTIAIGAPPNGGCSGHVRVYSLSSGNFEQVGQDIDGEVQGESFGFAVSLSADGLTVAIGAIGSNAGTGRVRVYSWTSSSWVQLGQDIDGEAPCDNFGWSVALSDNGMTVAVGANLNNAITGHVRVYTLSSNTWIQVGSDIDGESANDQSGWSVALSGDGTTVAIGAPFNSGTGSGMGQVRVYTLSSSSWVQVGQDIDGEMDNDSSGYSIALSADGNTVAIGSPSNTGVNGTTSGHVRVYSLYSGSWVQIGSDIDGEAVFLGHQFGRTVALSADGTKVVIGGPEYRLGKGHVEVYQYGIAAAPVPVFSPVTMPITVPNSVPSPPAPAAVPLPVNAPVPPIPAPIVSPTAPVSPVISPIVVPTAPVLVMAPLPVPSPVPPVVVPIPAPIVIPTAPITPVLGPLIVPNPAPISVPLSLPVKAPVPIPVTPVVAPMKVPVPVPIIAPAQVPALIPIANPNPAPISPPLPLPVATAPTPVKGPVPIPSAPIFAPVKVPEPVPVTAPVLPVVPASIPVTSPVVAPLRIPLAPATVPFPVPVRLTVPVSNPVTLPINMPSPVTVSSPVTTPVNVPVPIMAPNTAPTTTDDSDENCGLFGLNFFCPRFGECGFWRRLLNLRGC